MRKVVLAMSMSLDGFVARANGDLDWIFPNMNEEALRWTYDSISTTDTQLLGGVDYQAQSQYWPTADGDLAPLINGAQKIVFSSSLKQVDWQNARLAEGSVPEEVAKLREQPGKDILVPGGARFAQSMSKLGLVDEYRLFIHPVVLGTGLPLFTDPVDLKLQDSKTFETGAIVVTYQRA
jgi:dihydrofolate reductase